MTEHDQTTFHNGELVTEDTHSDASDETTPVEPDNGADFRVEAKPGALEVNTELRAAVEQHGHVLGFNSHTQAIAYADQLSATGGDLRLQAVAPNGPADIDAYLLADHNPSITEPATINGDTWTFDVGANLYGTLGEALLTATPKPHALLYYVKQDLDVDDTDTEHRLTVDVETDCVISLPDEQSDERNQWNPDCKLIARNGWNGPILETYYCEIKTGDASFERTQRDTMQLLAEDKRVLNIRVLIDDLPDQYSLRIHEVTP